MIHSFIFSEGRVVGRDLELEALRLVRADKGLVIWVDLDSPTDEEIRQILDGVFQFHPLAIEDCATPSSLPKIEDYDEYLFVVMHGVDVASPGKFDTTELDLFLGREYLVTFHRTPLPSVQALIDRCTKVSGVVARGPDRLAHNILDHLVDNYKPVIDTLHTRLDEIEDQLIVQSGGDFIDELLALRREISQMRQIIRPQRDVINRLAMGESRMIRAVMLPYFRDIRDHLMRYEETAAGYAEQLLLSFDLYLNKASFQTNEGIKVLTALTALTIPAILVGTWYGMNFRHMPELEWPASYAIAWAITILFTVFMWLYLKRKKML